MRHYKKEEILKHQPQERSTSIFWLGVFSLYYLYFTFLFSQFPLNDSLAGNLDTWFAVAFSNHYVALIRSFFSGEFIGNFLYPQSSAFWYGESAFGSALPFVLARLAGLSDVFSYYLTLVFIYSLTALSVCRLSIMYLSNRVCAVATGFFFATSGFMLGNIDSLHTVFLAIAVYSLVNLKEFIDTGSKLRLGLVAILGGLQVYFSAYAFLLQTIALASIALANFNKLRSSCRLGREVTLSIVVYVALATPFFVAYFDSLSSEDFVRPWSNQAADYLSINSIDLTRKLEGTLLEVRDPYLRLGEYIEHAQQLESKGYKLYSELFLSEEGLSFEQRDGLVADLNDSLIFESSRLAAFPGFMLLLLAVIGAWILRHKAGIELGLVFVVGMILSFGSFLTVGTSVIPMPLYYFQEWLPEASLFRVPSRLYMLSLLVLCICAGKALESALNRFQLSRVAQLGVVFFVITFVVLENTPRKMLSFRYFDPPSAELLDFLQMNRESVFLHLPSDIGLLFKGDTGDLIAHSREILYMNWQSYGKHNTVNGVHGYFPRSRIHVQKLVAELPDSEVVSELASKFDVEFIVLHPKLALSDLERSGLEEILRSERLEEALSGEDFQVLRVVG